MAGGSREPGRSVLSRALSVLAAFETRRSALSQSELVEITGLPQSTVHRLAAELVEWGALTRDEKGRYQIGLRLWELSQNAGRQLRETSRPHLQDLRDLTGRTSQLAVRDGLDVVYVDRVHGTERVPRASRVGGRLPLHVTAVGRAILAFEEPWVRDGVLAAPLRPVGPRSTTSPTALREELERVREQGWSVTCEEVRAGACSIAVPVMGRDGSVSAGLGLVVPTSSSSGLERHVPVLQGIAQRLHRSGIR